MTELQALLAEIDRIDPSRHGVTQVPTQTTFPVDAEPLSRAYAYRNWLVLRALGLAAAAGYGCGIEFDDKQPGMVVVCIDLPTGQVSWHVPEYGEPYDGHDAETKSRRIAEYVGKEVSP